MSAVRPTDPSFYHNGLLGRPKTAQNGPNTKPQVTALKTAVQNGFTVTVQNTVKAAQSVSL